MSRKKETPIFIVPDEEVAYRLVKLYFEEVARLGFKRTLSLDAIMNAYFYALQRMENKGAEMAAMKKLVKKEESELLKSKKLEDLFPIFHNE